MEACYSFLWPHPQGSYTNNTSITGVLIIISWSKYVLMWHQNLLWHLFNLSKTRKHTQVIQIGFYFLGCEGDLYLWRLPAVGTRDTGQQHMREHHWRAIMYLKNRKLYAIKIRIGTSDHNFEWAMPAVNISSKMPELKSIWHFLLLIVNHSSIKIVILKMGQLRSRSHLFSSFSA